LNYVLFEFVIVLPFFCVLWAVGWIRLGIVLDCFVDCVVVVGLFAGDLVCDCGV